MISIPERELVSISELKVDGDNPNHMTNKQHARLKTSIEKYGFIVPIITNKDLLVADGEQRLTVAKSLSMAKVPVIRLPVEDVDRRLLRQVLNKLKGEHDLLLDAQEFSKIIEMGGEDDLKHLLDLSDNGLEKYLREIRDVKEEDYEVPEIDKIQTDIKQGDIIKLGKHRLMCGDATKIENICMLSEKDDLFTFDVLLTDPPYGIDIIGNSPLLRQGIGGAKATSFGGKIGGSHVYPATAYNPIIGDDTPFNPEPWLHRAKTVIIFGANYFSSKLPDSAGWFVWDKTGGREWNDSFANCELIWSNLKRHATIYCCTWKGMVKEGESGKRVHPTQKPIKLLTDILNDCSKRNDNVLDPYGGSGSTLIACEQTGRTCYMMEIDPRYCQVIIDRWQAYTGQKAESIKTD